MALLALLKRMNPVDEARVLRWRDARTGTAETAHTNSDKTEAAYARGGLFAKRAELVAAWGSYCLTAVKSCCQIDKSLF